MRKIHFSRKKIARWTAIIVIAVGAYYVWRDLNLDVFADTDLPDLVVENIDVERKVGSDDWTLSSPRVEHKDGVIYGTSLDVSIKTPTGRVTNIFAEEGTFTRENNDITLTNADGAMVENNKVYNMKTSNAVYKAASETWFFDEGIILSDDKMVVEGSKGYYNTKNGECRITEGGTVTWSE
ncbi:MAG: LPS export ABC transporter periplasmic protein LptC [Synergistes sp.]|nr:LPS export ABC transporter periplasmic protein LptC [Synergistes sp.]